MVDDIRKLLEDIEQSREPEGFNAESSHPAELRRAAQDYRACYTATNELLSRAYPLLLQMAELVEERNEVTTKIASTHQTLGTLRDLLSTTVTA